MTRKVGTIYCSREVASEKLIQIKDDLRKLAEDAEQRITPLLPRLSGHLSNAEIMDHFSGRTAVREAQLVELVEQAEEAYKLIEEEFLLLLETSFDEKTNDIIRSELTPVLSIIGGSAAGDYIDFQASTKTLTREIDKLLLRLPHYLSDPSSVQSDDESPQTVTSEEQNLVGEDAVEAPPEEAESSMGSIPEDFILQEDVDEEPSLLPNRNSRALTDGEIRAVRNDFASLNYKGVLLFDRNTRSKTKFSPYRDDRDGEEIGRIIVGADIFPGTDVTNANASLDPLPVAAHEMAHYERWSSRRQLDERELRPIDEAMTSLQALYTYGHRQLLEHHVEQLARDAYERLTEFVKNYREAQAGENDGD